MTDIDLEAAINYVRPVAESATVGMYGTMLKTVLDAATRLREAEAVLAEIRANAAELLDADDDSYDGSLSAIWVVELIDTYQSTKTEATDCENGSE